MLAFVGRADDAQKDFTFATKMIVFYKINPKGIVMEFTDMRTFQQCIKACQMAILACQECCSIDIREGGIAKCALINLDCAEICAITVNSMARGSVHHADFCALCAHLCRECAAACALHSESKAHCARCKQACETCAKECDKHASLKYV